MVLVRTTGDAHPRSPAFSGDRVFEQSHMHARVPVGGVNSANDLALDISLGQKGEILELGSMKRASK